MPQVAVLLEASQGVSRAMLLGVLGYVRVHGPWSLNIAGGGTSDLKVPDLRYWKGSGIIGRVTTPALARDLLEAGLPAVLINPDRAYRRPSHPLSACGRTRCDSQAIGRLAAEDYLAKAFRHFAFVGDVAGSEWSRERQQAFSARLRDAGQTCDVYPRPRRAVDWDSERPRLCGWLSRLPKPVAILAANDNRARQVLDACLVAEVGVPYEAAVLGVNNDILICETCIPPLSSIAVDAERAGYEAARLLDELMRRPATRKRVVSYGPTGIVARASTDVLPVGDKRVIRALEFIRINRGLNIRVSDVAGHLGVSSRWAEMRFKEALGHSVHAAIQRTRMTAVCAMLRETDLPLKEISRKCGFAQPNHLCKLFKDTYGCTMSRFRHPQQE